MTIDPLDRMERLTLLGGVSLFSGLTVDDLESISDVTSVQRHEAGEMLVLVEGSVDIAHRSRGTAQTVATLGVGAVVGEFAIFSGSERTADVVAGPDGVTGLVIEASTLDRILQERPQIALALLAALAEKLAAASVA